MRLLLALLFIATTSCSAPRILIYKRIITIGDFDASQLLQSLTQNIGGKTATINIGRQFPEDCDHRELKQEHGTYFYGLCIRKKDFYIYVIYPDRGRNIETYSDSHRFSITFNYIKTYEENVIKYLQKEDIRYKSDDYVFMERLEFMNFMKQFKSEPQ